MNKIFLTTALLMSSLSHAFPAADAIIEQIQNESKLVSMVLEGESSFGGHCWVNIEVSGKPYSYFSVALADENNNHAFMAAAMTPVNGYAGSSNIDLKEGDPTNPRRAGQNRFVSMTLNDGLPTEVTAGYHQMEPQWQQYEMRCYSLVRTR